MFSTEPGQALRLADVLQEFVSGVARTIHKGNEVIVRTADLRSVDVLDPTERLPRQERILRAAMQEVVEQIHRDQRQQEQEEQRGQQQGSQAALQQAKQGSQLNPKQPSSGAQHPTQRGSTASKNKTTIGNREEACDRDSGAATQGSGPARRRQSQCQRRRA